jgi:hypothetical protein
VSSVLEWILKQWERAYQSTNIIQIKKEDKGQCKLKKYRNFCFAQAFHLKYLKKWNFLIENKTIYSSIIFSSIQNLLVLCLGIISYYIIKYVAILSLTINRNFFPTECHCVLYFSLMILTVAIAFHPYFFQTEDEYSSEQKSQRNFWFLKLVDETIDLKYKTLLFTKVQFFKLELDLVPKNFV